MPIVNICFGSYCDAEAVVSGIVEKTGYRYVDDATLIGEAGKRFGIEESRIRRALTGKTSIFDKFTHEKDRCLAYLQRTLADLLEKDETIIAGAASLMVPREVAHALNVCLIADMKYRTAMACRGDMLPEKEAAKKIRKDDEMLSLVVDHVFGKRDPWSAELYDMVIPMNKFSREDAVSQVCDNLKMNILEISEKSMNAVRDFALAAEVNLRLAKEGHNVSVSARDGVVTMEINKHVLMLSALEEELKKLASSIPGVKSAVTKVGPGYYKTDVYRKFDFEVPGKVLLVDDEREFAETLSERLQMRDYASAVVFGGEEALSVVEEDEPEVMVLDLKMPGIDGLEVLRRVKEKHPAVEVIVLTGHGSEEIRSECIELGACAYLEKPVDIEKLTEAMREAYDRVKRRKLAH